MKKPVALFDHNDETDIQQLLMGRRVINVDMDKRLLLLDNGTAIEVIPNEGGCACSAGDYELESLATVDNIITKVEVINDPSGDGLTGEGYLIYVYADNQQINLMSVTGDDGNGYYGTGYSLRVTYQERYEIQEMP